MQIARSEKLKPSRHCSVLFIIAWLSPLAFVVLVSLMALFVWFYYVQGRTIHKHLDYASKREASFFGLLNHMLHVVGI